jgi:hypothetical protein
MVNTASAIVAIFGFLILAACCWGVAVPTRLLRNVEGMMSSGLGMGVAIGVRLILGVALIVAGPASWTPKLFFAIGGLSVFAAMALPFIGRPRVEKLVQWLQRGPVFALRFWLVFGAAFGAYLIYAVII